MAYHIEKLDKFFKVQLTGDTSKYEILQAVREMQRQDPVKALPDVWVIDGESQIPLAEFADIAEATRHLFPPGVRGNRSALVASDEFHRAQLDLYPIEAADLPIDIRVFLSYEDAVAWVCQTGKIEADEA